MSRNAVLLTLLAGTFLLVCCTIHIGIPYNDFADPGTGIIHDDLTFPRQDKNGWTIVSTSDDTRTVYVSSSTGNDSNSGLNAASPVQTIAAGRALLRNGQPDHLLLRRGDVWDESISWNLSGRSRLKPIVVSYYGNGGDPRPMLRGLHRIGISGGADVRHVWFIGIEIYCPQGDDSAPEFDLAADRPSGFGLTGGGSDILVEDCKFSFLTGGLVIQSYGGGQVSNIKVRRCVITDMFSTDSHSQGMYTYEINGLLIEENVFDHNGWRIQGTGDNEQAEGRATMFNHNAYLNNTNELVIRGNLFLRGSSIGVKMCSDQPNDELGILFENNFFYDGEIGISIGGNGTAEYRFVDTDIINNVFCNIGLGNHTSRNFSWGVDISDNCNGRFAGNMFINQPYYGNSYAFHMGGISNSDIDICNNLIYNVNGNAFSINNARYWKNIRITDNIVDDAGNSFGAVFQEDKDFDNFTFSGNTYKTSGETSFRIGTGEITKYLDLDGWRAESREAVGKTRLASYPHPQRTLESYCASVGGDGTSAGFIADARALSKSAWNSDYTAAALNEYLREGFAADITD